MYVAMRHPRDHDLWQVDNIHGFRNVDDVITYLFALWSGKVSEDTVRASWLVGNNFGVGWENRRYYAESIEEMMEEFVDVEEENWNLSYVRREGARRAEPYARVPPPRASRPRLNAPLSANIATNILLGQQGRRMRDFQRRVEQVRRNERRRANVRFRQQELLNPFWRDIEQEEIDAHDMGNDFRPYDDLFQ